MAEKVNGKALDTRLIGRLLSYTRPYQGRFVLALVSTLVLALLMPVRPMIFQHMLDNEIIKGDLGGLRILVVAVTVLLMVQALVTYYNTYLTNWLGQSVIRDIREQVFQHITRMRLSFFDSRPIGMLQTRTISDVETLNDVFTSGLVRIFSEILQLLVIMAAMFYTNWRLSLMVLTTMPLLLFATYVFKNSIKQAFQGVREAVSNMNAFLQEHITGMSIVHIFNREEEEMSRFQEINRDLRRANLKSVMAYSIFFPVVEIITALGMAILVWYGASRALIGELQFGVLVAFIMYIQMFFRPLRMLADQFNTLQLGMVSAERIFKVLDTEEAIPDEGKAKLSESDPHNGVQKGISIAFEEVNFAYKEPDWVLDSINLKVNPGEKVALVGATGSGKTTIINLLSRFYEIQKGKIYVNGTDIKSISLSELRQLIGVVLQDVFLFSGSIRQNITLNNDDVPMEAIIEAARQVGADGFIQQLPGGYDYQVRERGVTLSLGQRQLIAFARVLIYDPAILVLDEATANIDTESEEVIQHAIDTIMAGRTSIIIAHRLSTIQKADKIVVLEKGRIIEMGSHQELLQQEGAYHTLHQLQFAG
ncbi:MAG: ABC transporter ATP-binding protein [Bacteroidota bacterium]